MRLFFILLLSVICLNNCTENKNERFQTLEFGSYIDSVLNCSPLKTVAIFDGDCSTCIVDFINFNERIKAIPKVIEWPIYHIVLTSDPFIFNVNLRRAAVDVVGTVLIDTAHVTMRNIGLFHNSKMPIFLMDKENKVLRSGNPFLSSSVKRFYKKMAKQNKL